MCYIYHIWLRCGGSFTTSLCRIASEQNVTEIATPCVPERYVLNDVLWIVWNIIAVDEIHRAEHVSKGISLHKLYSFVVMISVLLK